MKLLFLSPSWILSALLVMFLSILLSLAVLAFVRRTIPAETRRKNHDVAGFTFSIVGVLYSVVLGFTVISVQDRYNEVLETIHTEAMWLADLYRDAALFPAESKQAVRSSLRAYVKYVINEEWNHPHEKNLSDETQRVMENIWNSYYNVDLPDEKVKIWYGESILKLDDFMNARLKRQFSSFDHLTEMMWALLLLGGFITVCFMFFFGLENHRSQMLMTALLSGYLSFMLFLVYSLDHVFEGPQRIKPTALEQVGNLFDRWDNPNSV